MAKIRSWPDFAFGQNWIEQEKEMFQTQQPRLSSMAAFIERTGWEFVWTKMSWDRTPQRQNCWQRRDNKLADIRHSDYQLIR